MAGPGKLLVHTGILLQKDFLKGQSYFFFYNYSISILKKYILIIHCLYRKKSLDT